MTERVRPGAFARRLPRLVGVAMLILLPMAACSSDQTKVRGEVLTKDDPYLGGPNPVVSEFRAGERDVYGDAISP